MKLLKGRAKSNPLFDFHLDGGLLQSAGASSAQQFFQLKPPEDFLPNFIFRVSKRRACG
jgi:hypothetical protein